MLVFIQRVTKPRRGGRVSPDRRNKHLTGNTCD